MKKEIKRWSKNRISYIHYSFNDFNNFDSFVISLLEFLKANVQYSLLLKVRYKKIDSKEGYKKLEFKDELYGMLGEQIGFKYSDSEDIEVFDYLHESLIDRLNAFIENYEVEVVRSIQLLYVRIEDMPELKLQNVNKVTFNKEFGSVRDIKSRFNIIPLTINEGYFGKLILKDKQLFLNVINTQRSIINKDELLIDNIDTMYLYEDKFIIISYKNNDVIYRSVYNCKSGILINNVEDRIVNDEMFIRKIGNIELTVLKENIIQIESQKKLFPIKYVPKLLKDEPNPFIGSWDIETFEDSGIAKVYALGFTTLGGEVKTYYLDDSITSEQLVLNCINDMLSNEYNGYTFYTHNFGRYDCRFLLKILLEENLNKGEEYYKLDSIVRDSKIFKLVIKVKRPLSDRKIKQPIPRVRTYGGYNTINIVDSLNILNQSLDKLCHSFNVDVTKGKFPHSFVRKNTLNYVGNTPDIKYWDGIELEEYNSYFKNDWNLKEECLKYLERDLVSLTLIMNKFSEYINRKFHLQVTDSLTISRLALNIFLKDYLKDSKLPIVRRNMFHDIKQAYYGGVTEVYKPFGENLFYYDVNSLYPFAALNPMPGINCTFIENTGNNIDLNNLFGFFYCEVTTTDNYLGLLPLHVKDGLIMPNGNWKGWYFSEELKFASEQGYKIKVIKGYNFDKMYDVFTDYVNDLYKIKSTTKDSVEKDINKRLLNHLLGRFGMNIVKPVTELVNGQELSLLLSSRITRGEPKNITDNDFWLTYNPEVDQNICEQHGLDYFKVCKLTPKTDIEKFNEFNDVSLTTAAAVTGYARIYMSRIKLDILNKGGNIYYTDTDSIVTDISIDDKLVGSQLGQFKLEYKVKKGYFISNKTYCLMLFEKIQDKFTGIYTDLVIKSKTVKSNSLIIDDFVKLLNGKNIEATKRHAITNHKEGSVLIRDATIELKYDSYTKRQKIFKRSKWIDTKPIVLDEANNSVVLNTSDTVKKVRKKGISSLTKKGYRRKFNLLINWLWSLLFISIGILLSIIVYFILNNEDVFDNYFSDLSRLNKTSNSDLDLLLESKYLDDYLEEPIELEINKAPSYFDAFLNLFDKFKYYPDGDFLWPNDLMVEVPVGIVDDNINRNWYSLGERPQVLSTLLRQHLDEAYGYISILNDKLSASKIIASNKDLAVKDVLTICDKALKGSPFSDSNSPVFRSESPLYRTESPILRHSDRLWKANSPILEADKWYSPRNKGNTFIRTSSPFRGDISSLARTSSPLRSPFIDSSNSVFSNSPITYNPITGFNTPVANSPVVRWGSPLIKSYSPVSFNSQSTNTGHLSNITSEPLHNAGIDQTTQIKRFGHVWSDNFQIDKQHPFKIDSDYPTVIDKYHPMKRYGCIFPYRNSILENYDASYKTYDASHKRYGRIWSGGVPILKDFTFLARQTNSILVEYDASDIWKID